jgi:hypothetical protein
MANHIKALLGGAFLSLATLPSVPAGAAVIVLNISGAFGAQGNALASLPFEGAITYDTSTLTYRSEGNSIYGSVAPNATPTAGSYNITYGGSTFASTVRYIQTQNLAHCNAGGYTSSCFIVDMLLKSPVPGHNDGRLYMILKAVEPFNAPDLPEVAPSSQDAYYAFFQMPQQFIGTRTTETHPNPAYYVPAGAGASLSFGPASVPEASSWIMMILGFGAIGAAARRQNPWKLAALAS